MTIKLMIAACFIVMMAALPGCNAKKNNHMDENAAEAAETLGDLTRKNSQTNEEAAKNQQDVTVILDGDFVLQAIEAGNAEVKLGKLAMERGKQPTVREFGEMMTKDHSAANKELTDLATAKGIKMPEKSACGDCQNKYRELAGLKGDKFDKRYIEMMLEGHRSASAKFSREASSGEDADLKAFATKTLPVINHHLDLLERMDGARGK